MADRALSVLFEGGSFFEGPRWHGGRWWVSDFYRHFVLAVAPDGTVAEAAPGLRFPNGPVVTPDGSTLIVGESFGCRYSAFTIAADGSLTERRVWAQLAPTPTLGSFAQLLPQVTVAPDGCGL